jgi:IS5 family transposase
MGRPGVSWPAHGDPATRPEGEGLRQPPLPLPRHGGRRRAGENRTKSKVRAKIEHPIGIIKRVFGFVKVRYRGLTKNAHRLVVTCALANLFTARRHLLRCPQL